MTHTENLVRTQGVTAPAGFRATGVAFAEAMRAIGASVDVVDLPKAGIHGNSHMMMMDKNNIEVANLIQAWLEGKGLTRKP